MSRIAVRGLVPEEVETGAQRSYHAAVLDNSYTTGSLGGLREN